MYVYVHTYYQNLPYFTFWGMAVNRFVHDHAPSTCFSQPVWSIVFQAI